MIAALRNWLLLVLFMIGAINLWEIISRTGWMNFWSRQCYFHANSNICSYGAIDTAAVLAAITVFIVCLWLFVMRIKIFEWWTLLLGSVIFGFLAILINWYVISQAINAGISGTLTASGLVNFLNGRGELIAAAIAATLVIILQSALKPKGAK